jgi:hypothetical protein
VATRLHQARPGVSYSPNNTDCSRMSTSSLQHPTPAAEVGVLGSPGTFGGSCDYSATMNSESLSVRNRCGAGSPYHPGPADWRPLGGGQLESPDGAAEVVDDAG